MNLVAHIQPPTFSRVYLALHVHAPQPTTKTDQHCSAALLSLLPPPGTITSVSLHSSMEYVLQYITLWDTHSSQLDLLHNKGQVYTWVQFSMTAQADYSTKVSVVCDVRCVCSHATLQTFTHMYRLSLCYCP